MSNVAHGPLVFVLILIFHNVCLTEGGFESEAENGPLAKATKLEKSCEAQSYRAENEETEIKQEPESTESNRTDNAGDEVREIKLESDDTYTFAYSVIFKDEHDSVKEEEQGGIDHQTNEVEDPATNEVEDPANNEVEDPPTNEVEDPATNEVEDPPTNEGVDLNVGEMKYEVEEDNNLQVTTQVFIFRVIVLKICTMVFG
jgi:hypothetical protein